MVQSYWPILSHTLAIKLKPTLDRTEDARATTRSPQGGPASGGQESAAGSTSSGLAAAKNHAGSVVNPADLHAGCLSAAPRVRGAQPGGERGIRTPVPLARDPVFKTGAIGHSAISPASCNRQSSAPAARLPSGENFLPAACRRDEAQIPRPSFAQGSGGQARLGMTNRKSLRLEFYVVRNFRRRILRTT